MEEEQKQMQDAENPQSRVEYVAMWGEDNPDVDFENKDERYRRMRDDRMELRDRRRNDAALGGLFEKNDWLATMYLDLKDNPDINPFVWLADFCKQNDMEIKDVLEDPEAQQFLTQKMAEREKATAERQAKDKAAAEEKDANLLQSLKSLEKYQEATGMDDEACLQMWGDFWNMIEQAQNGVVPTEVWKAFANGRSYEADMQSAADKAAMMARNEKIQNKVRKPSEDMNTMPPTLPQGNAGKTERKRAGDSFAKSFFEDMR